MEENVGVVGAPLEDAIVSMGPEDPFDRDKFDLADKKVEEIVFSYTSGSISMKEAIGEINELTVDAAARERYDNKIMQGLVKAWWTLRKKGAVKINNDMQREINVVLKESEQNTKQIVYDISETRSEQEGMLINLADLKEDIDTYEYAKSGYVKQIGEIDGIVLARSNGDSLEDELELSALPLEYLQMDIRGLTANRSTIESKMLSVDIETDTLYAQGAITGKELEASESKLSNQQALYKKAIENRDRQLRAVIDSYSPDYMKPFERLLDMAVTEERLTDMINSRIRINDTFSREIAKRLPILLNPYRGRFESTRDAERAKKVITSGFGKMSDQANVSGESFKTEAKAVFNKYLP